MVIRVLLGGHERRGAIVIAAGASLSAAPERPRLSSASVGAYLRERGVIPPRAEPTVRGLSGGISNTVLGVKWSGGAVVVKQSLPKLRVAVDWEFDPRRIIAEAECMAALADLVAAGEVPTLMDLDRERLAFTMSHAPTGGTVWKEAGRRVPDIVNPQVYEVHTEERRA
jgi:5-methylthioribose kinase